MRDPRCCWCGETRLTPFRDGYLECRACATLVREHMPSADITRVRDEDQDLYGRRYWFDHQEELGNPDLASRSLSDVSGRCLHWLRTILSYRPPPARVLELGAGHGGLVALLEHAGYDATGLEISPWVAQFARDTFAVRMIEGPLEDHRLAPASFDIIVAMDLLEHLAKPMAAVTSWVQLLAEDGVLLVQTPSRAAGESYSADHPFARMLLPEHLFLFTQQGACQLLQQAGLPEIRVETPFFPHTDMFLVAGRHPLARHPSASFRKRLLASTSGRLVLALLDVDEERGQIRDDYLRADTDRVARLAQVEELHEKLHRSVAEWQDNESALRGELSGLEQELGRLREATAAQLQASYAESERLEQELDRLREDAAAQLQASCAESKRLAQELDRLREDAAAQLQASSAESERLAQELDRLREDGAAQLQASSAEIECLEQELGRLREQSINLRTELEQSQHDSAALEAESVRIVEHHELLRSLVTDLRRSRVYRAMVGLGRWRRFECLAAPALGEPSGPDLHRLRPAEPGGVTRWAIPAHAQSGEPACNTIGIDLTALIPGGENGGAKLVAVELVKALGRLLPDHRLLLLTTPPCHAELAALEADNISRRQVELLPWGLSDLLDEEPLGLLFSPMTAPPFRDPRVPVVSLVHDLQFLVHPELFSDHDRHQRAQALHRAVTWSDRIVTVSEHVRSTVLEHSSLSDERVIAIHNGLADRFVEPDADRLDQMLTRYGLEREAYLLYPANFWPHKNHRMLLVAFSRFRHRNPEAGLQLVLTGADRPDPEPIREDARRLGLDGQVLLPGFVPDADLAGLLDGCRALIFPSLYEGFGIPVVEAMARGRPVLCSNISSLPEVAGDAALLFDPRKPAEITTAIERIYHDHTLCAELQVKGRRRAAEIGGCERMARDYLDLFEKVLAQPVRADNALSGVYPDRWSRAQMVVHHAEPGTTLRLQLANERDDAVTLSAVTGTVTYHLTLAPWTSHTLICALPEQPGWLQLRLSSTFIPAELGLSNDTRALGVRIASCHLSGRQDVDLLAELVHA